MSFEVEKLQKDQGEENFALRTAPRQKSRREEPNESKKKSKYFFNDWLEECGRCGDSKRGEKL